MKKVLLSIIFTITIISTSCDKVFMSNGASNDGIENFESMWHQLNEKYSFFAYKKINWDSVYNVYRPQVDHYMLPQDLFDALASMMNALYDGHSNIFAPFDYSRNWSWYLDYPPNFDYNILERNYLGDNYSVTGPFKHKWLDDDIVYIYYSSFSNVILTQDIWDHLIKKYANCAGVIFDIRNNGGGYATNVGFLGSQFVARETNYGFYQVKNGPNPNDFSERINMVVAPAEVGDKYYSVPFSKKKVTLLTNRHCYSAANFFTMLMKELRNVTVVGDKTGGGGGLPMDYQLPNGWNYRFSATATYTKKGVNIEHGIQPDVRVNMTDEDMAEGKDTIIETAIAILKGEYKGEYHE